MVGSSRTRRVTTLFGLLLLACTALPVASSQSASASTTNGGSGQASQTWSSQEADAVAAISDHAGSAPTGIGPLSPVEDSSFNSSTGEAVQVEERSFTASIEGVPAAIILSLLNDNQLIVNYVTFGASFEGESLVLEPGSSTISGAKSSTAEGVAVPESSVATVRPASPTLAAGDALLVKHLGLVPKDHRLPARLDAYVYAGYCEEYLLNPETEGTDFGVLVQGLAGFVTDSCNGTESVFVGLNYGTTQLNDVNGSSGNPDDGGFGSTAYWPCYGNTNIYPWYTRALFEASGGYYGYTQGPTFLNCTDS
jgi:hypothetical protein